MFAVAAVILASAPAHATAGKLKICKQGSPEEWPEPAWWRGEVIVPAGAVFKDVGPISDSTGDRIKLRIVTTQKTSLAGDTRCKTVDAKIPEEAGDWGAIQVGPVVLSVAKSDGRLLEIEKWGNGDNPPPKLAPWADVAPVEATVETDFR